MSLLQKISDFFNRKKKREDEWAKNFAHIPPAKPDHLIPLDPNDPWKT